MMVGCERGNLIVALMVGWEGVWVADGRKVGSGQKQSVIRSNNKVGGGWWMADGGYKFKVFDAHRPLCHPAIFSSLMLKDSGVPAWRSSGLAPIRPNC